MKQKNNYICAIAFALCLSFSVSANSQTMASTNYKISWHVTDGGGGTLMSSNYTVQDTVAQPTPIGEASSVNYIVAGGFHTPPDSDNDQVRNFMDNCTYDSNPTQLDSNGDGYGNRCDPDLDNSGTVNFGDYGPLTAAFNSAPGDANWNPDADLNGDNFVNFGDISIFPFFFLMPPGPSALAP